MSENDWRDFSPGRTGVSVAQLEDGESAKAQIIAAPYRESTSESENALHVPVVFMDVPEGFEDMSGDSVEVTGDGDGEDAEYNIINSSSGFFNALLDAFPEANPAGQMVSIEAYQPGEEAYSRFYEIEAQ